jgi:hypothetical protein
MDPTGALRTMRVPSLSVRGRRYLWWHHRERVVIMHASYASSANESTSACSDAFVRVLWAASSSWNRFFHSLNFFLVPCVENEEKPDSLI